jgi:hypothetical protein
VKWIELILPMGESGKPAVPWPDVMTARRFLGRLVDGDWGDGDRVLLQGIDQDALAGWLVRHGLAPFAYSQCRHVLTDLGDRLEPASLRVAACNTLRFHQLSQVLKCFQDASIPVVVLKGAALARGVYGDIVRRPMGDVDLWVRDTDMPRAADILRALGFRELIKDYRPLALQALARGERQFRDTRGMVELHWSPFPGWLMCWTAAVDEAGVWERAEPLDPEDGEVQREHRPNGGLVRLLSAEDMVIQLAAHLTVTHRVSEGVVRGLMDIALTARARPVDWDVVVERATAWRLRTAVWVALDLASQLVGLMGVEGALTDLRPPCHQRALLRALASPTSVLAERDLAKGWVRFLIWLVLVDRPRDAFRLAFRTLWPERAWMAARYGEGGNRWHHLWNVMRHGEV